MRKLVIAFAGRTYHIVGNLRSRLIYHNKHILVSVESASSDVSDEPVHTRIRDRTFAARTDADEWGNIGQSEIPRLNTADTEYGYR